MPSPPPLLMSLPLPHFPLSSSLSCSDLATMRQQHANLSRLRADMSPSSPSHSHSQILPNEDDSDEVTSPPSFLASLFSDGCRG
jgi:hypothetical protein